MTNPQRISPRLLAQVIHGADRLPTEQQAAVTAAEPGPMLVVAGAGAGKTETMASRVVWLVANGYARPEEVLGLTFTHKAAQELSRRIRQQLAILAGSPKVRDLDPSGQLATMLVNEVPTVSTYDSYAGKLIKEYGLLVPVEPDARVITDAEYFSIAHRVVRDYRGSLQANSAAGATEKLRDLISTMDNSLLELDDVAANTQEILTTMEIAISAKKRQSQDDQKHLKNQYLRLEMLPLVEELRAELRRQSVVTFGEQMSVAARLVRDHPGVGESQRRRYKVIMLDEYQDTSHAQRVLLSGLFGHGAGLDNDLTVTAVGDPMQAIYGWRGATVENLAEFVNDFPTPSGPAPKLELTTSWRNPAEVLKLANTVADDVFGTAERPVSELQARDGAGAGDVSLNYFPTVQEEREFVADQFAARYQASIDAEDSDASFSAAILVRNNSHSAPMAAALEERGVPCEIIGLGGLLDVPEVADLIALATMLIRPGNPAAALRVISGPIVGLGLADLVALGKRASQLSGTSERAQYPEDPQDRLNAQLDEAISAIPEQQAGLGDAIADLGPREAYSEQGYSRLAALSAKLGHLRRWSLGKALPDVFADIEELFGIRTEVMAQAATPSRLTAVHLDAFADVVAHYPGDGLGAFLDYLELARNHEKGLTPGDVTVRSDRVQIMTVHKSKGLEWDTVAVVHADHKTYTGLGTSTFLSKPELLPDDDAVETIAGCTDPKDFAAAAKEHKEALRQHEAEESERLFYVATTRTAKTLLVTGSEKKPYEPFDKLAQKFPQYVGTWQLETEDDARAEERRSGEFPGYVVDAPVRRGAEAVRAAAEDLPQLTDGEVFQQWEREVSALIAEHEALQSPTVEIAVPDELTASDMVAIRKDALQFARRQRRPVPFKPNSYAKRGTAFHEWLEDRFGATALLDEDELPGMDEPADDAQFGTLKEKFLASQWAERTPEFVEHPFEVSIGGAMVRGRIDAIFREPDGSWLVVDWKTGQFPQGQDLRAAEIQLAVYSEAWRRMTGSDDVAAAFHYVMLDRTFRPQQLPDGAALEHLVADAISEGGALTEN